MYVWYSHPIVKSWDLQRFQNLPKVLEQDLHDRVHILHLLVLNKALLVLGINCTAIRDTLTAGRALFLGVPVSMFLVERGPSTLTADSHQPINQRHKWNSEVAEEWITTLTSRSRMPIFSYAWMPVLHVLCPVDWDLGLPYQALRSCP